MSTALLEFGDAVTKSSVPGAADTNFSLAGRRCLRGGSVQSPLRPRQSTRRHLSSATSAQLRTGDDIQCDNDNANVLTSEIARIEEDWQDDGLI